MILHSKAPTKRHFNVNSKKDIEVFISFMQNDAWGDGGCPFFLEEPYHVVPEMIKDKLLRKFLKIEKLKIEKV